MAISPLPAQGSTSWYTWAADIDAAARASGGATPPDATATAKGVVELATDAEVAAGTDTTRAITPASAKATYVAKADAIDLESTQDSIAGMFTGGTHTGITFAYDDAGAHVNATVTGGAGGGYTDEQVMDLIGSTIIAGSGLVKTVDDAANTVTLVATASSSGTAMAKAINGINCYGDSITEGGTGGNWPTRLAAMVPVPVINYGVSGQESAEVALRNGGLEAFCTVTGGQIPASGSVAVTLFNLAGVWRAGNSWSFPGSLAGIPGSLAHDGSANFTFTRTSAGSSLPVSPELRFVSDQRPQPGYGAVIWAGRNNIGTAADPTADIKKMAAQAARIGNPYIILSITNGSAEPSGSTNYNTIAGYNATLAADPNYYDMRGYMIRNGLADAGITPTAADTTAIAEDRIPASLMSDALHPNAAGWTVIANRLARLMIDRGWFTTTVAYPGPTATPAVTNTVAPAITGTATTGSTLTVSNGTWTPTPDSYTYQWKRAGSAISGATAATYLLVVADEGQAITCTVTAVKAGYTSGSTTSNTVTPAAVGGGGGSAAGTDTFNRADSTTGIGTPSDGGAAWVTADTWGIASNNLYQVGTAANAYAVRPIGSTTTRGYVEAVLGSTTTIKTALTLGRFNGSNQWEGYNVFLGLNSSTDMQLWKITAGTSWQNVSGPFGTTTVPYAIGDTIRIEFVAGTIKAYRNGTQIATGSDATYANVTHAGVIMFTGSSVMRWDSIALGTF